MNIHNWFDPLAIQLTLKSLLQHHSSKALILWHSAFFIVQLSDPYMTTGKTIALARWTFVSKVMSLLFNMLSRFVIAFLPKSKYLLISWLQSLSAVILESRDQWRNNSRKNEGMEPKQKHPPVVDVTGDRNKIRCYKEQYCIGTWKVRSMIQGKLEVV